MELISTNSDKKNLIFGKYKLTKIIGSGSFGYVYEGVNVIDNKLVAVKVEQKENGLNLLEKESFYLYNLKGIGVPEVVSFGYSGKYSVLVQSLLGESLGKIFFKNNNYFSLKDICMFSIQILHRIEYVHSKFLIHRDIKPENFLIGEPDKYLIYIIDFGLSKKYKSSRTNKHIQFQLTKKFTGTARYASLNAIRGAEQSRRDDLEAIGYMLLFFFNHGRLPWQGISCKAKAEKYVKIYNMKKKLNLEEFCKNMPEEMIIYMKYCRKLEFEQKPNYEYLRKLFENVLKSKGYNNDLHFSWIKDISILKNYNKIKNKIVPINLLSKRKESPQSRIFKKLEGTKGTKKEKESENDIKSLKTNNSLQSIYNIGILKSQTQSPQFSIHKRFNSSGDNGLLRNKGSDNFKSGIAQYNISIEDEAQFIDKTNTYTKQYIDSIKENLNKKRNFSCNKQNVGKNNLYYFSGNMNELCKSLVLKKMSPNKLINDSAIDSNNNTNDYEIKKQNTNFNIHNKFFSSNSVNKNPENYYINPNIIKPINFIKKTNFDIEEKKGNNNNSNLNNFITPKYQKIKNIQKSVINKNFNSNNNNQIKKINFTNKYNELFKNNIKYQNFGANISNNKIKNKNNINASKKNNNNANVRNKQNNIVNITKIKKMDNTVKKDKKRKIIKMKVKNFPNIKIQISSHNLNCKSAVNILNKNTSPNNGHYNQKNSFIQNINNKRLKNDNPTKIENFSNNLNINNVEGKINKIKNMNIHSNIKKIDCLSDNKKMTTKELFKNKKNNSNLNIYKNNNYNNFDILNINQTRITKYKNLRHKISKKLDNFPNQNYMTRATDISLQKPRITNNTAINSTLNNCNTVNNTINSNNNNNTIISIYNNYNIDKFNNRYGFMHKKIDSINIALDTLNNINKEKYKNNNYCSYNGYKVKLNNYKSYIHLYPRKNTTFLNMPSSNQLSNYATLNSRLNNENNHYSQIISNKDLLSQDHYQNKKISNYFSLNNKIKNTNEFKNNKIMNLSSSRPNLNSYRIKKILNEFNRNGKKIKKIERNKTDNLIGININNFINNKEREKNNKKYDDSCNILRSNSYLYRSSNFMNFDFKRKKHMNKLGNNHPSMSRKNTEIFFQGLPNFKMNYNIYDSNLTKLNDNESTYKNHRSQRRDYYNYKSNREKNNFGIFS